MDPNQVEESVVSAACACSRQESPSSGQVIAEVQQGLEAIRLGEMRRRAGKLRAMSKE